MYILILLSLIVDNLIWHIDIANIKSFFSTRNVLKEYWKIVTEKLPERRQCLGANETSFSIVPQFRCSVSLQCDGVFCVCIRNAYYKWKVNIITNNTNLFVKSITAKPLVLWQQLTLCNNYYRILQTNCKELLSEYKQLYRIMQKPKKSATQCGKTNWLLWIPQIESKQTNKKDLWVLP